MGIWEICKTDTGIREPVPVRTNRKRGYWMLPAYVGPNRLKDNTLSEGFLTDKHVMLIYDFPANSAALLG